MASTRNSALSKSAIDTFTIHDFIYHIILKDETTPDYLTEVILTESQELFFKDIILEAARGTQYDFNDKSASFIISQCTEAVNNPNAKFVEKSRLLAEHFLYTHPKNALNGIFVVARVTMEVNAKTQNFIAILKIDYTKVLEQIRDESDPGIVSFHEIVDSLSEDKKAIQKRALIDVSDSFDWDVIAIERNKTGQKLNTESAISDYFRRFLDVSLKMNGSTFSRKLPSAVNQWAKTQDSINPADAKAQTVAMIKANDGQSVLVDDIRDSVCAMESSKDFDSLKNSFDDFMDKKEYQFKGAQFVARANSIAKTDELTTYKTNYGVIISFEGTEKEARVKKIPLDNGQTKIEIIADRVE